MEFIAAVGTAAMVGLATGFTTPLVSLRLDALGANGTVIGAAAAMPAAGFLLSAMLTGTLVRRFPARRVLILATLGSAVSILSLAAADTVSSLIAVRLLMGVCTGLLVIIGETWINQMASDSARGRMVAVYTTAFTLAQTSGPALLALLGTADAPILVAASLQTSAVVPLLWACCPVTYEAGGNQTGILSIIRDAPAILTAVLAFAFFDSAVLALMPLYGIAHGLTARLAALTITATFLGDTLFQVPLGWLADRIDHGRLHVACGALALVLALSMDFLVRVPLLLWPALVAFGAATSGVYTLGLIRMGNHFRGSRLTAANAAAGLVWGLGGLVGPVIGGSAVRLVGSSGLMMSLALVLLVFLASARVPMRHPDLAPN
jgi:MFS family permease